MPANTHKQRILIEQVLASRYEAGDKIALSEVPEGSLFIVQWYDTGDTKYRYAIMFSYRRNKNETVCTYYNQHGEVGRDRAYENTVEVVLLIPVSDKLQGE